MTKSIEEILRSLRDFKNSNGKTLTNELRGKLERIMRELERFEDEFKKLEENLEAKEKSSGSENEKKPKPGGFW